MMPDPSSGDDAQGASDDGRSLFCDMQRAPRGSTCGLPFAYAACRAACGCDFACVFVCGMPCACTPVRSPVCYTPRRGRAAEKMLVPRSASCPLPDAARCGGDTAAEACAATLRVSSFAACRALALVFAARFAMPRGVGVRLRRGSCRGRHPVRCRDAARYGGDAAAEACAATLRVSSFAACRALALVFAARFAMPRGVGVRPRRGSCRGRHPVRCRDAARYGGDAATEAGFGGCGVRRGTLFARLAGGAAVLANGGGEDGGVPCNVREVALRIGIRLLGPEENAARAGAGICGIGTHAGIRL